MAYTPPDMSYQLGIDLGTTYTAAAVAVEGRVEPLNLGTRSAVLPTVVFARDDGELLVGDAAETRGVLEPTQVAREFKRRLGDTAPLVLGGVPYSAEALMGAVLGHVHRLAVERMGGEPSHVVITHPATYSAYRLDLLRDAVRRAGFASAELLTEPQAAATHYASFDRVAVGDVIAVYDLGGGTFDAAIVRNTDRGFELLGQPHGLERLGGIDFDVAVLEHVNETLGGQLTMLPEGDSSVRAGLARLRADARHAKEVLSTDTDTTIPLIVPGVVGEVTLSRGELERLIVPRIRESITVLRQALASAGLEPADLSAVLLVGGSSQIPAVRRMVTDDLRVKVTADVDPEMAVALGAARHAALGAAATQPVPVEPVPVEPASAPFRPAPPTPPTPVPTSPGGGSRRGLVIGAVAAVAVVLAIVGFLATRDSGGSAEPVGTSGDTTADTTSDTTADTTSDTTGEISNCDAFVALIDDSGSSLDDLRATGASGCDLTGLSAVGRDLTEVDLSGADLSGADLSGADLSDADVSGATLDGAVLDGATLTSTAFTSASLRNASLVGASAVGADFGGATLDASVFVEVDCSGCNFDGAVLAGSDMAGTNLSGANITNADMESVGVADVTVDESTVMGPAPGNVQIIDASGQDGAGDAVGALLEGVGYVVEIDPEAAESSVSSVSCRGDFFGSEMRKLFIALDNFVGTEAEEIDFDALEFAPLSDDIACIVVLGPDISL